MSPWEGTQDPSLSQVPLQLWASQSGQHKGPTLESDKVQHREPAAHSACDPPDEHDADARVMQTP